MVSRDNFFKQAREGVREKYSSKDLHIMQAVRSLDDIDEAKSLLFTRLTEWYKLNFPELELSNEETYCAFVAHFGGKEDLDAAELAEVVGEAKAAEIAAKAKTSFGAKLDEADSKAIRAFADHIGGLIEARKELEGYITEEANKIMPNLSYMLEPTIAARLLTVAGGLEKLAVMPASTVQVIGAENALFKHLRAGTNPPKHGIIFQSAYVRGAPLERRGRIARALAAKLAIAAKADFFSHNFIAEKLKEDLDSRVKEVDGLNLAPRQELTEEEEFRRDFGFSKRGPRKFGDKPGFGGDRPRYGGDRPRYGNDRPRFGGGERRSFGDRPRYGGDRPRPSYGDRPRFGGDRPRPSYGDRPRSDRPSFGGDRPRYGSKPSFGGSRSFGGSSRPHRDKKPFGGKRRHR